MIKPPLLLDLPEPDIVVIDTHIGMKISMIVAGGLLVVVILLVVCSL